MRGGRSTCATRISSPVTRPTGTPRRSTRRRAQGATADVSLLLVDDRSYREAAYTGLSRGRAANRVYVVSDDLEAVEAHGISRERGDDLVTLREAMARSAAQEMASRGLALGR